MQLRREKTRKIIKKDPSTASAVRNLQKLVVSIYKLVEHFNWRTHKLSVLYAHAAFDRLASCGM